MNADELSTLLSVSVEFIDEVAEFFGLFLGVPFLSELELAKVVFES